MMQGVRSPLMVPLTHAQTSRALPSRLRREDGRPASFDAVVRCAMDRSRQMAAHRGTVLLPCLACDGTAHCEPSDRFVVSGHYVTNDRCAPSLGSERLHGLEGLRSGWCLRGRQMRWPSCRSDRRGRSSPRSMDSDGRSDDGRARLPFLADVFLALYAVLVTSPHCGLLAVGLMP